MSAQPWRFGEQPLDASPLCLCGTESPLSLLSAARERFHMPSARNTAQAAAKAAKAEAEKQQAAAAAEQKAAVQKAQALTAEEANAEADAEGLAPLTMQGVQASTGIKPWLTTCSIDGGPTQMRRFLTWEGAALALARHKREMESEPDEEQLLSAAEARTAAAAAGLPPLPEEHEECPGVSANGNIELPWRTRCSIGGVFGNHCFKTREGAALAHARYERRMREQKAAALEEVSREQLLSAAEAKAAAEEEELPPLPEAHEECPGVNASPSSAWPWQTRCSIGGVVGNHRFKTREGAALARARHGRRMQEERQAEARRREKEEHPDAARAAAVSEGLALEQDGDGFKGVYVQKTGRWTVYAQSRMCPGVNCLGTYSSAEFASLVRARFLASLQIECQWPACPRCFASRADRYAHVYSTHCKGSALLPPPEVGRTGIELAPSADSMRTLGRSPVRPTAGACERGAALLLESVWAAVRLRGERGPRLPGTEAAAGLLNRRGDAMEREMRSWSECGAVRCDCMKRFPPNEKESRNLDSATNFPFPHTTCLRVQSRALRVDAEALRGCEVARVNRVD